MVYGIHDPLGLGWRKLCVYTQKLPYDSRTMFRIREAIEYGGSPNAPEWLVRLNKLRGVKPRKVTSR